MVVDHGDRPDLDLGSELCDRGKNRRSFCAIGHSVGRVLYVATTEDFAVRQKDGSSDSELRVRSMSIFHSLLRRAQQLSLQTI